MNRLHSVVVLAILLALTACRAFPPGGQAERVIPDVLAPQPIEAVVFYPLERPAQPYTVIANLTAEADSRNWPTLQETKAQAYETLRRLAAQMGANGVIDIEREILRDGAVVMGEAPPEPIATGAAGERYVVKMRARAVRIRE